MQKIGGGALFFLVVSLFFISFENGETAGISKKSVINSSNKLVSVAPKKKEPISLTLAPLEKTEVRVKLKNTGTRNWGSKKESLHLVSQARQESYLYDTSWNSKTKVISLSKIVSPGKTLDLSFQIEAPQEAGTYHDAFLLFAGTQKISSSEFFVNLSVTPVSVVKKNTPSLQQPSDAVVQKEASLGGERLIQSAYALTLKQRERIEFRVGFKNSGTTFWKRTDPKKITLRSSAKKESYFYDPSWLSQNIISELQQDASSGQISFFVFFLEAPLQSGTFEEKLSLYYGEDAIPHSEFSIPITVQDNPALLASFSAPAPSNFFGASATSTFAQVIDNTIEQEPSIRVGLFSTKDLIKITAQKPYEIRNEQGQLVSKLNAGDISTVAFDFQTKLYSLGTPNASSTTPFFLKFGPPQDAASTPTTQSQDTDLVFEISSYNNRPGWSTTLNDNKFRNRLEVRYASKTDKLWLINELPFETYLKGIAETSNNSPYEFQKTLIVAARTFGKYHIDHGTKHAADNVTVLTTDADQIYRGYNAEIRLPNVSRAVDETRGVMVYYGGNLAITPYFSQSDGRTRGWTEVWGGDSKPWLLSKDDPCCKNLPMLGHGVGMSARGAVMMALDGKGFGEILQYYYTGIELRRRYK